MPKRTDYLRSYLAYCPHPELGTGAIEGYDDVLSAALKLSDYCMERDDEGFQPSSLDGFMRKTRPEGFKLWEEFVTAANAPPCNWLFRNNAPLCAPLYIINYSKYSLVVMLDEERVDYIQQALSQGRAEPWPLPTKVLTSKPTARTKTHQTMTLRLCGNTLWQLTSEEELLDDVQIRLLILEEQDKERVKFERLQAKFAGIAGASVAVDNDPIPENVRIFVWRRDQGKCVKCGKNEKLHFDHIIPRTKGGGNTERNVQLLCQTCNQKKGAGLF